MSLCMSICLASIYNGVIAVEYLLCDGTFVGFGTTDVISHSVRKYADLLKTKLPIAPWALCLVSYH